MVIPKTVDRNRWSPSEDRTGQQVAPGDRVSVPLYPRGMARGNLVISERAWAVLPNGDEVLALEVLGDDGVRYTATSKIRKLRTDA